MVWAEHTSDAVGARLRQWRSSWALRFYVLFIALPLLAIHGLIAVIEERRLIAALEVIAADVLSLVEVCAPLALSVWLGFFVFRWIGLAWLAWLVGVVTLAVTLWITYGAFDDLPGIGWRIQAMKAAERFE